MTRFAKSSLFAALLFPATAFAQIQIGDALGASERAIRSALEAQGYAVTEFELEEGEIEVEATAAGQSLEIEVSPETGLVLAIELEDEDDDDEDDD